MLSVPLVAARTFSIASWNDAGTSIVAPLGRSSGGAKSEVIEIFFFLRDWTRDADAELETGCPDRIRRSARRGCEANR